jgi:hypothetical protein
MHRIDNASAASTEPTVGSVGPNPDGFWTTGNPSAGVPATVMDQDWFQAVQEELMTVLATASVAPVKGTFTQLMASLRVLFGGTGNLTNPAYMRLPGGVILQMGSAAAPNSGGSSTALSVTFPLVFPTGVFAVLGAPQGAGNSSTLGYPTFSALSVGDSGFLAKLDMLGWALINQTVTFSWAAIGI